MISELGAFIGEGHFGKVYVAIDDVHRQVAVKVFSQRPDETEECWKERKASLLAEGQRLSLATHDNVVQVHYFVESANSDAVLLVMDYCSGGSLENHYVNGPMSLRTVQRHSTDILIGLHALHSKEMLHRDIKPGNLLIDKRGVTRLGDFGLVTDKIILGYGTASYGYGNHFAPEIHFGGGTSVKTDIWAMGMTIYRLLHGHAWYMEMPPPVGMVVSGRFAQKLRWLPHIPTSWRTFVKTALNDDPALRFQTAIAMTNTLGVLQTGPDWRCVLCGSQVLWERMTGDRRIKVRWDRGANGHHEWSAWSESVATGRRYTLGGSKQSKKRVEVDRELRAFFTSQF